MILRSSLGARATPNTEGHLMQTLGKDPSEMGGHRR